MRFTNLNDWLAWQESLNPKEIDLGLERVSRVLQQAGMSNSFDCPLITVAGTNGKGSVAAILEAIAMAAGLTVCSYTSPHLFKYNERIKINGQPIDDNALCKAFERIDQARSGSAGDDLLLTYFEFGTLAAIDVFFRQAPDLVILEVGLGGRLDAVNIMEPDISVLTSVAVDHTDWLGDDRESIGFEKAGIFRQGQTVICGESEPPASVMSRAQQLQCELSRIGQQYSVLDEGDEFADTWALKSIYGDIKNLPQPALSGDFQKNNAATAILALQVLAKKELLFSVSGVLRDSAERLDQAIRAGLGKVSLPGRFQKIKAAPAVYVDVAHNPQAASALTSQLKKAERKGLNKTWAVVAMLADKDISGVIENVSAVIDHWCFAGLGNIPRGLSTEALIAGLPPSLVPSQDSLGAESGEQLAAEFSVNQCTMLSDTVMLANTVTEACECVLSKADKHDRIIIFGSFYTVAESMQFFTTLDKDEYVL